MQQEPHEPEEDEQASNGPKLWGLGLGVYNLRCRDEVYDLGFRVMV